MIFEVTNQVRVADHAEGQKWYTVLFGREPDFIPHEGFAEWELLPGCWLQVAEGIPSVASGPLRFGVLNIESERERLVRELQIEAFAIHNREEVPVRWGTFSDPWGNRLGFFEYKEKTDK